MLVASLLALSESLLRFAWVLPRMLCYLCCVKGLSIRLLPFFALISSDPVDRFLLVALFWLISHKPLSIPPYRPSHSILELGYQWGTRVRIRRMVRRSSCTLRLVFLAGLPQQGFKFRNSPTPYQPDHARVFFFLGIP